ncbi:MAG: mechanosensitive ion channel family protein [Bacteroidota bacterium]
MFSEAINKLADKLTNWVMDAVLILPNLAVAILVLLAFVGIARLIAGPSEKILDKLTPDRTGLSELGARIIQIGLITVGLFIGLHLLHLDQAVASLLAGAGIIGLALGFAFQDITANFLSGIFIATRQPFQIGDTIETNDFFGKILNIQLRATTIRSVDGQEVILPNKDIFQNPIKIFTTGQRRIRLPVQVTYDADLELVERTVIKAIQSLTILDQEEKVRVYFRSFAESAILLEVFYWIQYDYGPNQRDYFQAISDGIKAIKTAFTRENIRIPYPIRTLDINPKHLPKAAPAWPGLALNYPKN